MCARAIDDSQKLSEQALHQSSISLDSDVRHNCLRSGLRVCMKTASRMLDSRLEPTAVVARGRLLELGTP
jgi:hypothetical protein